MITLAVAAILLGVGIPSFTDFIRNQELKTASSDVASMLLFARSEAIKRNATVLVTPHASGWQEGWTVTLNDAGNTLLGSQGKFSRATITSAATAITYGSSGRVVGALPSFTISGTGKVRCVRVTLTGIPNTEASACS